MALAAAHPHNQLHDFALGSALAGSHRWRRRPTAAIQVQTWARVGIQTVLELIELTDDQRSAGQVIRRGKSEAGRAEELV